MPEGPSIFLLKEDAAKFEGEKISAVSGNSKLDKLNSVKIVVEALSAPTTNSYTLSNENKHRLFRFL